MASKDKANSTLLDLKITTAKGGMSQGHLAEAVEWRIVARVEMQAVTLE